MTTLIIPAVDLEPWPTLGPQVVAFIEENLVHGPGDLLGQPVRLDDEKKALTYRLYEVFPRDHPQAGRRRFKRGALSVRKGWAKTEFAAMLAAVELHPDGPVRTVKFDGHDEPVGDGITDPYIPMIAYTEEQSDDLAYSALKAMLERGPLANDFDIGLMRIMRKGGDGKAVSLAGSPDARDGARTTFQIADETHRWTLPRLRSAHRTMLANLAKRKIADPWALEITTSYSPGEGSVAEDTMDYARAVAEGAIAEPRFFFFHRQAKDAPPDQGGYDLTKPEDLRAAAIEASGPSVAAWSDIDAIVESFQDPKADKQYLCRVWFNWISQHASRAFDAERWRELVGAHGEPPGGTLITLGFDGSRDRDATALVGTVVETGYQWVLGIWERPLKAEFWEVDVDDVNSVVADAFARFQVWLMYADRHPWETMIAQWAGEHGKDRVKVFDTNSLKRMAYALRSFEQAIKAGELSHDGSDALQRHIGNACRQLLNLRDDQGERMWKIQKEKPDSPHKIDAAIAACLSWEARNDAVTAGAQPQNLRSFYETHDLVIVS